VHRAVNRHICEHGSYVRTLPEGRKLADMYYTTSHFTIQPVALLLGAGLGTV